MASTRSPLIAFSRKLYATLLKFYPHHFRGDYGTEMATVFHDVCQAEYRHQGAWGVAKAWVETVPDLVVSVADEHAQEDFQMTKSLLTRGLGLAGIVGGAVWVAFGVLANMAPGGAGSGASRDIDSLIPLLGMAWLLVPLGLLGIYLRYSSHWSVIAKIALPIAILSGLEVFICFMFNIGWPIWTFGWFGFALGVLVSGVTLLAHAPERSRAMLLTIMSLSLILFNFEDWRVLFGCAAGICLIVLNAPAIDSSVESRPPTATA